MPKAPNLSPTVGVAWGFAGIFVVLYLALVIYLAFVVYGMSHFALFVVVLLGSFAFPVIVPGVVVVLLGCGVITGNTRIVVV